jgi:PleD family two-component response regulator
VARILRASARKIDVVARYGGEEFAPKGPVPPNQPNAYNAVEVMRNLEPKLDR